MFSYDGHGCIKGDNFILADTLVYNGCGRGRSAVTLYWHDSAGINYPMFMSDFNSIMKLGRIVGNEVTGKFTAVKKGANGIQMIIEGG